MNTLCARPTMLLSPILAGWALGCVLLASPGLARAQGEPAVGELTAQVTELARRSAQAAPGLRVAVEPGTLDPRLKLAPCQKVETYLPPGFTPWGKTRIGLRCLQGSTRWNVYLPITVKVFGRALVAVNPMPVGALLTMADLREDEIDLAADRSPAVLAPEEAIGRTLTRAVSAGDSLRQNDLKARQWFAAGDTVRIHAVGPGFSVQSEGQAMTPGLDGSAARVRIDNGRIVSGTAVGERLVELRL